MGPQRKKPAPVDLDAVDWGEVRRRLTLFAKKRLGSRGSLADAEELAQEATRRFLDPNYASWNPETEPDLLRYLGSILNGVLNNWVRRKAAELETPLETSGKKEIQVSSDEPSAQRRISAAEQASRAIRLISERIVRDKVVEDVFLLEIVEEVTDASEQARRLGLPVSEIYKARRRLGAHREAVQRLLEAENSNVKKVIH